MQCNMSHHVIWWEAVFLLTPIFFRPELIGLSAGTSKVIWHISIDLPAIVACSFSFASVARLWLSVLPCPAIVNILKFVLPFTNVKFIWGICFKFSSWLVQILQINFFCWLILKILSHGNFSFHFLNVAFFGNFWCCKLRIIQVFFLTVFSNLWIKQHSDLSLS